MNTTVSSEPTNQSGFKIYIPTFRLFSVLRRNFLVWQKLLIFSVIGNIAEPLIFLVALGYGVGSMINEAAGLPYIVFLASGSIVMSAVNSASFEGLYSAYTRMIPQKTWDSILNTSIDLRDIVYGEIFWAACKGMITVVVIMAVLFVTGIIREWMMILALPGLLISAMAFSSIALFINSLARGYDFFTFYFTIILIPMSFLSGIYFPLDVLPPWLVPILAYLPLNLAVDAIRPLMLGKFSGASALNLIPLLGYFFVFAQLAIFFTVRRFAKS